MSFSILIIIFLVCVFLYFMHAILKNIYLKKRKTYYPQFTYEPNNTLLNYPNTNLLPDRNVDMTKTIYIYDYYDVLFEDVARFVIEKEKGSTSMIQRMFKVGFNRASRILEQLEDAGIVGPDEGIKPRKVLITLEQFEKCIYKFPKTKSERINDKLSVSDSLYNDSISSQKNDYDTMTGEEFEKYCVAILKKNNFINVRQTKSSGDQGVDILAEKDGIKYAIQCKCYSKPVGNHAIQEVYSGKNYYNCHIGVVLTNQNFTESATILATKTNILLWDRNVLNKLISSITLSNN